MTNSRPNGLNRPSFNRNNINELCTERCMSRRETLEQLLKLTREVTSEFKKQKNVMPRRQINAFAPQNHMRTSKAQTTCLDGKPGVPVRVPPQKQRRVFGAQANNSRGPALSPTMAYQAMMKLCDQLERDVITSAAGDSDALSRSTT